jgi:phospholipase C
MANQRTGGGESRRDFLKKAALAAGAAAFPASLRESICRAAAIEPTAGTSFWDADHVVILMQENRSLDHCYGTLRGVRGFNDPRAMRLPNGDPVWVQTDAAGNRYAPFRMDIKGTNATWMGSLPHGWTDQVDARNGGRYDRWLDVKRSGEAAYADMPLTLGYYTREDIPFYYELADAFTICDQNFCSSLTGTTPNRLHLWTGTIRAKQQADAWAHLLNSECEHGAEVSWPTFPERLEDHGTSWKIYQNELYVGVGFEGEEEPWLANFGDNPIEYFTQFKVKFSAARRRHVAELISKLPVKIEELHKKAARGDENAAKELLEKQQLLTAATAESKEYSPERWNELSERQRRLHELAFATNAGDLDYHKLTELVYRDGGEERRMELPAGDLLHQFRADVAAGQLPAVSWIVPPERLSDHPCSAWYGAWCIAEILDILTQNTEVWKKTIFILTYDENDGYFDHVPPFAAAHPRRPETGKASAGVALDLEYVEKEQELKRKAPHDARDNSIGLGYRVPMVIASPWSRGGAVCSQVFDHTSPIQFLEKLLSRKSGRELREPQVNSWRRTVCGDLTAAFAPADGTGPAAAPTFPPRDEFFEQIHRAQFKLPVAGFAKLSDAQVEELRTSWRSSPLAARQEPGVRPACPLPYELAADASVSEDGKRLTISMEAKTRTFGDAAAGAPFIVIARHGDEGFQVRNYAVAAGDRLEDAWELSESPNGEYHLEVYGPNGFYRAFRGARPINGLAVQCRDAMSGDGKALSGDIEIELVNHGASAIEAVIDDPSYGNSEQILNLAPGNRAMHAVKSSKNGGWYDAAIRADGGFEWRYAGRVETGQWSTSDPAIG